MARLVQSYWMPTAALAAEIPVESVPLKSGEETVVAHPVAEPAVDPDLVTILEPLAPQGRVVELSNRLLARADLGARVMAKYAATWCAPSSAVENPVPFLATLRHELVDASYETTEESAPANSSASPQKPSQRMADLILYIFKKLFGKISNEESVRDQLIPTLTALEGVDAQKQALVLTRMLYSNLKEVFSKEQAKDFADLIVRLAHNGCDNAEATAAINEFITSNTADVKHGKTFSVAELRTTHPEVNDVKLGGDGYGVLKLDNQLSVGVVTYPAPEPEHGSFALVTMYVYGGQDVAEHALNEDVAIVHNDVLLNHFLKSDDSGIPLEFKLPIKLIPGVTPVDGSGRAVIEVFYKGVVHRIAVPVGPRRIGPR